MNTTRSIRLLMLLLAGLLFSPPKSWAVPWVERHGMTAAMLQSEFQTWTAPPWNYRLTRISGSEVSGGARYTAIFEKPAKKSDWQAWTGMNAADFQTRHQALHADGHRLVWLDSFSVGGTALYSGIWEVTGGAAQRVRLGESLAAHALANNSNSTAGYHLTDVSACSVQGSQIYSGVWAASRAAPDIQMRYGQGGPDYQTAFNALSSDGYQLWRVSGADAGGFGRYTSVWRRTSLGEGWAYHGMSAQAFEAESVNARLCGYRPVFIDAFNVGSGTYYNALWIRNGGLPTTRLGTIFTLVQDYMTDHNLPGLSVAIAREGRLVYARGFGYADTASGEPAHGEHRWRIASTSKPVAAVSALRALEDSGAWSLDSKCFGSGALFGNDFGDISANPYSSAEKAITARQLMNMTAGWNSEGRLWYGSFASYGADHSKIIGYQLDSVSPFWTPGTHYQYNNFNYQAVARIPEKISGQTFFNYTNQQVFIPCGITGMDLGNRTAAGKLSSEVTYYAGDVYGDPETVWPARMDGSTGWVTAPSNLLLLARRIDGNTRQKDIIGSYALSQMQTGSGQPDSNGNPSSYGLGWYASSSNGRTWWQHNGSMAGTQALLCVSGDGSQSFAYAANSVSNSDAFSSSLRALVLNQMAAINTAGEWPAIDLSGTWNPAYDAWATAAFGSLVTGRTGMAEVWAPTADPDDDGRPNAMEAFLGSDPLSRDDSNWASPSITAQDLVLRWARKNGNRGAEPAAEWSTDLKAWSNTGAVIVNRPDLVAPVGHSLQEVRVPRQGSKRKYVRLSLDVP
ncbi:MAG: hypothetical protein JWM59_2218 [Verrucomicrobiales bacterium]|nr:hypothetical protein [Verrucomicrobiales bacterium]